jgi:hypothetical protein
MEFIKSLYTFEPTFTQVDDPPLHPNVGLRRR